MNDTQRAFLRRAADEASKSGHLFPPMAACEAALESNYGLSGLARDDNNLFGMKLHSHPDHPEWGQHSLPTREFENGQWISINSNWMSYPDWAACFRDRMGTLYRLANLFPHYKAALSAPDAESYIAEVSKTWSTDPNRGAKVLSIYQEFISEEPTV
jgi:flagellum-specific peptidoglycan hydrolase FlgJ